MKTKKYSWAGVTYCNHPAGKSFDTIEEAKKDLKRALAAHEIESGWIE